MLQYANKRFWQYVLLAYGFSWLLWIPLALAAQGLALPAGLHAFLEGPFNPAAFGPLVAALVMTLREGGGRGVLALLKRGVDLRFDKRWLLPILLLPLAIFAGAVFLAILTGKAPLDLGVLGNPPYAFVAFFVVMLTGGPFQEEFGWRGYALPRLLAHFDALRASLILGAVWWLWHLPLVFIPGKFMTGSLALFVLLAVEIILMTVLFTWIYNNTGGSVLAAILFHTSMNWSLWAALPGMQVNSYIIAYTIALLTIAVVFVVRKWGLAHLSRAKA